MTMSEVVAAVVRRFDVEVAKGRVLADVKRVLGTGDAEIRPPEIKPVGATFLEVRLEGSETAVSAVITAVAGMDGVRIHNDRIRWPQKKDRPIPRFKSEDHGGARRPTVVAVIDSGIMVGHPDLKDRLWKGAADGKNWKYGVRCIGGTRSSDVTDQNGHGTRLAGTIIAAAEGATGVQLMAVKFFDPDALPGPDNGAAAIEFAMTAQPKADIINLSWDLGMGSLKLEDAIKKACKAGALVVIAAGNSGADNDTMPAIPAHYRKLCPEQIITVMATDQSNEKASFSNYGKETVDLAAPGVDIATTRASLSGASENELKRDPFYRQYRSYNGTSAAAALVSGMAARLKSVYPELTAIELKDRLCAAAKENRSVQSKCVTGRAFDLSDLSLVR
jgi:thermitase